VKKSTSFVRKANSVSCKVVAEPRNLTYSGVPGGQGLGLFSPGIVTRQEDSSGNPEARNTISRQAYEIDINPGYVDAVTASDFRIKRSRFFGFVGEFTNPEFQEKVERFFTAVEAGKEKLVARYGSQVPRSMVEQLANEIAAQGLNVGPCWKVVVHLNRCASVPFDRSAKGRDGLFHRTDRTKVIWLPSATDAQLKAMLEYLAKVEDLITDSNGERSDTFVTVTLRQRDGRGRFIRDNRKRSAVSGRNEARIRSQNDPIRAGYKPPDASQVDMG
jgi:hypothetical protein